MFDVKKCSCYINKAVRKLQFFMKFALIAPWLSESEIKKNLELALVDKQA